MTRQQYERISAPFCAPARRRALNIINTALTGFVYVAFILLCLYLLLTRDMRLIPVLLITGIPFVALSFIRKKINAPRPYEALDIQPLIQKDTKGKSFPSRHVFSAFVIAVATGAIFLPLGVATAITAALLMVIRVIGGVHFPKDVIAGALSGILCGAAGILICRMLGGAL